ncbi:MAG: O-antigen polysaccharide polymerase Wzy [Pirellulales bacterium]|nr:O-antigen polysaccharide polymerase Wzy [Pirellulales bacterium]
MLCVVWPSEDRLAAMTYPFCVFQGLHFIWVLWSWKQVSGYYFSPYTLFFIAVQLFNGGDCLLEIFHLNKHGVLSLIANQVPADLIHKAVALATTGMACIHLGALLGAYRRRVIEQKTVPIREISIEEENSLVKVLGWLFFAIGAIPATYTAITMTTSSIFEGYLVLYHGESSYGINNWVAIASLFAVPGMLMLLTAYSRHKLMAGFLIGFAAFLCFSFLASGLRGNAATLFLATVWLFHFRIRRIPAKLFVFGVVAAFLICPAVAHMRHVHGWNRFSPTIFVQKMSNNRNPVIALVKEMGTSLRTVSYTMMLVPEKKEFMWGSGYLWTTTTVLPNVFWKEHPALKRTNFSPWLTKEVNPKLAAIGGGVGFSVFAEMYLNFSWFGTPLACIVLGYAIGAFSAIADKRAGPMFYAIAAILISILPYFARASSMNIMRPLVWFCVFPCIVFYLWRLHKKNAFMNYTAKLKSYCHFSST